VVSIWWRLVAIGCAVLAGAGCRDRAVEAGFWFERITFDLPAFGGPITPQEMELIASTASSELASAFHGLRIRFSDRRDARYHVRVVQNLGGGAGQSRGISRFGGGGAVSFQFLATGAVDYAPAGADRSLILAAIGRGIGRTAVHEFTHQLLPTSPIHDSTNARSYEFASAVRPEQYYGRMEWDLAWPLLRTRLGDRPATSDYHPR
jgi:hypothetical protein